MIGTSRWGTLPPPQLSFSRPSNFSNLLMYSPPLLWWWPFIFYIPSPSFSNAFSLQDDLLPSFFWLFVIPLNVQGKIPLYLSLPLQARPSRDGFTRLQCCDIT